MAASANANAAARRRSSTAPPAPKMQYAHKAHVQKAYELDPVDLEDLTHTALFSPTLRRPSETFSRDISGERLQAIADLYSKLGINVQTTVALFEDTVKFNSGNMTKSQLADAISAVSQVGMGNTLLSSEAQSLLWAAMDVRNA